MSDNFKYVQAQPFTLAGSGALVGATSITLSSFTQIDGTLLTMTDFGTKGFMTLEPGNGTQEEQISFTGVVQNSNGTATLSGVHTVEMVSPYTESSGLAISHAGGTVAVVSNTAGFYNALTAKSDDETITGTWTFTNPNYPRMDTATPAPTDNEQLATKKYVDDTAVSGAPNATTIVKGIVQLATGTQMAVGTATGSTGASLVPPNSLFNATSSGTIIAVVTDANGHISSGFGGTVNSVATLDSNAKVVQDPANATATPTNGKIPVASVGTKLADGWQNLSLANATTLTGGTTSNADTLHTHSFEKKIYLNSTTVTIGNSNVETDMFSTTLPANSLSTNNAVRIRMYLSSFTCQNAQAFTMRLKYGATTVLTLNSGNANGARNGTGFVEIWLMATGATNSQKAMLDFFLLNGQWGGSIEAGNKFSVTGTSAEDSTAAKTLSVTLQWGATSASMTTDVFSTIVELIQ